MSKLYYSESGHVIPTLCEELTDYRRARKRLELPATAAPATLFVLARAYPGASTPLRVAVNGHELKPLAPRSPDIYFWYELLLSPALLVEGDNYFDFWCDSPSMNAWSLALESGHRDPRSYVSNDGGRTWRNERMGYHNVALGEYVVRVRLDEGADPPPPPMVWEDAEHPRLQRLREQLSATAFGAGSTLDRVRALTTQVSRSWEYRNTSNAAQYAPWDAETIVAWGQSGAGHAGQAPVVMCVHYAVALATYCTAVGIPARCAVFTGEIDGFNGHFTTEVWFKEYRKWVMVDPTIDAVLFAEGMPLSVNEIQQLGSDLSRYVVFGPGRDFQMQNPLIQPWIPGNFLQGICFRHRSIWPRMDFLSRPELTPPGHGSTSYCETNLVWERQDREQGFGMFPYFADKDYFDAPPRGFATPDDSSGAGR